MASIEPAGPTQTGPSSDPALPTSLNRPHRRRARRSWCGSLVSPTRSVRSASGRTLSTPRPRSLRAGPWFSCSSRILSPCGQYENARFAPRRAAKRTRQLSGTPPTRRPPPPNVPSRAPAPRAQVVPLRYRKFADSPLEGDGFELPVRGRGQSGCRRSWVGCALRSGAVRARRFWTRSGVSRTRPALKHI